MTKNRSGGTAKSRGGNQATAERPPATEIPAPIEAPLPQAIIQRPPSTEIPAPPIDKDTADFNAMQDEMETEGLDDRGKPDFSQPVEGSDGRLATTRRRGKFVTTYDRDGFPSRNGIETALALLKMVNRDDGRRIAFRECPLCQKEHPDQTRLNDCKGRDPIKYAVCSVCAQHGRYKAISDPLRRGGAIGIESGDPNQVNVATNVATTAEDRIAASMRDHMIWIHPAEARMAGYVRADAAPTNK